jgi:hypothetical protein
MKSHHRIVSFETPNLELNPPKQPRNFAFARKLEICQLGLLIADKNKSAALDCEANLELGIGRPMRHQFDVQRLERY